MEILPNIFLVEFGKFPFLGLLLNESVQHADACNVLLYPRRNTGEMILYRLVAAADLRKVFVKKN